MTPGGPPRLPALGSVLGEHRLERVLGQGGMAAVFVGRHAVTGELRALKVMAPGSGPERAERFAREARALARLEPHPGVVRVHGHGVDGGVAWSALDLVEGQDLEQVLRRGALEPMRAARIGRGLAEALAHVHAAGVAHRDVKPGNILLRAADDAPVLVDFGIARDEEEARLTASHALVGTPCYMAPEQITADHARIGPATDVFALGIVLHEALTGAPLFSGEGFMTLGARIVEARVAPPSQGLPHIPPALDRVVLRALAADPADRPAAADLARALAAIERGESGDLAPPARSRGRGLALGLAVIALALGVVVGLRAPARPAGTYDDLEARALGPWALGVREQAHAAAATTETQAAGPLLAPPPDMAELTNAQDEAARQVAEASEPGAQRALERSLARCSAHLRLLRHRRGVAVDLARDDAGPTDLAVDALVLRDRGEGASALRRAQRAASRADAPPGVTDIVRLLEAEQEPARALARAAAGDDLDRPLAVVAARGLQAEVLARAAADLEVAARDLRDLVLRASARGADPQALVEPKRAALDGLAASLAPAIDRAAARGEGPFLIERVAALLAAPPAVTAPPGLVLALERLVDIPAAAAAQLEARPEARAQVARACRADSALTYDLAPSRPVAASLRALFHDLSNFTRDPQDPGGATALVVTALRIGIRRPATEIARGLDEAPVQALLLRHPDSGAALLARVLWAYNQDDEPPRAVRVELAAELDRLLAARALDDVSPLFRGEAHLIAAKLLCTLGAAETPEGRAAARRRMLDHLARARALAPPYDFVVYDSLECEGIACGWEGDREGAIAVWRRGVEAFEARLVDPQQVAAPTVSSEEWIHLGHAWRRLGTANLEAGRLEDAIAAADRAIATYRRMNRGDDGGRILKSHALRRLGRAAEAWEVMKARADVAAAPHDVGVEVVRVHMALDRAAEAARALRRLVERDWDESEVRALHEELGAKLGVPAPR